MISTVTTTTVTTVATLATGATLGALGILLLAMLLGAKEVVAADPKTVLRVLGRSLDIGILPLMMTFTLIAIFKILEIIG